MQQSYLKRGAFLMAKRPVLHVDSKLDKQLIEHIKFRQAGGMGACCESYHKIASLLKVNERTIRRHLQALRKRGILIHLGKCGKYAVWKCMLPRCRVVVRSFAQRVRDMSAMVGRYVAPSSSIPSDGRLSTNKHISLLRILTDSWPEKQKYWRDRAVRKWGAKSVLDALEQISGRYSTNDGMRVIWAMLAGQC